MIFPLKLGESSLIQNEIYILPTQFSNRPFTVHNYTSPCIEIYYSM